MHRVDDIRLLQAAEFKTTF